MRRSVEARLGQAEVAIATRNAARKAQAERVSAALSALWRRSQDPALPEVERANALSRLTRIDELLTQAAARKAAAEATRR